MIWFRNFLRSVGVVFSLVALFSCKGSNGPDVSDIEVKLELQRFEQDYFAIDTNNIAGAYQNLNQKYPLFLHDFTYNILGLPPIESNEEITEEVIRRFLHDYRPIKDSADQIFGNDPAFFEEVKRGLKYVKYYFPQYRLPERIISFIGPMDAYFEASTGGYGDVITENALAVGLQLHLGASFSVYHHEMGQALYPEYISRRFAPEYIVVNCMKNIIDDLFPDQTAGLSLIEQMVDKGKRMYILDKLLPWVADSLKIGYTGAQLSGAKANEGLIWNFFITNSLLYSTETAIIKNYIGDAPSTQELGTGSPGYIGLFAGWQIVKKYMENVPDQTLTMLMETSPRDIYEKSNYRPR